MDTKQVQELRDSLLELHKALLRYQQHEYELDNQPVANPAALFQLVTNHPSFAWLRSFSELIVGIDVFLDSVAPDTAQAKSLFGYARQMLVPNEQGNDFSKRYFASVQSSPEVALLHGKIVALLSAG